MMKGMRQMMIEIDCDVIQEQIVLFKHANCFGLPERLR